MSASEADAVFEAGGKLVKAASPLSEEEEYYLGRGVSAVVLSKYRASADTSLLAYLNRVLAAVAANSGRPETFGGYHVMLLETPELNAMSAPGGFVFVTQGVLQSLSNEEELAALLAHEVAHIALGHGVGSISQANLTEAVTILGRQATESYGPAGIAELTQAFGGSVKDIADTLLTKGYSRSQEYEADRYAVEVLKRTGYNAGGLAALLADLQAREKGAHGGWYDTHPPAQDRLAELQTGPVGAPGEDVRTKRFRAVLGRRG